MTVAENVKNILIEQLGVDADEVTPDASLEQDLGMDSLDAVEIVMAFEEEYGIEIPDEDAQKVTKVSDIVAYLERRLMDHSADLGKAKR